MAVLRDRVPRWAIAAIGIAVVWATVVVSSALSADLATTLLIVLAEVLGVSALSAPAPAVVVAVASALIANWYLVPPQRTLVIKSAADAVTLVVFVACAVASALIVEASSRARGRSLEADRRARLIGGVIAEPAEAQDALERVRSELTMTRAELVDATGALVAADGMPGADPIRLDIPLPDGYRLRVRGPELLAPDPDYVSALGSAALRAFQAGELRIQRERADELAAIDRARTALLAAVGHDLRTPLAAMRVSIDALRDPMAALDETDRGMLLGNLDASVRRLDGLIANLLDMSRIEAGAVIAQPEPIALRDAIEAATASMDPARIDIRLPPSLPDVQADPVLLERVIANLVANAVRASSSPVAVEARVSGDGIVLEISDDGPGLDPSIGDPFTPFARSAGQGDGGTGLGLAIVRGLAEAMGMTTALERHAGRTIASVRMEAA